VARLFEVFLARVIRTDAVQRHRGAAATDAERQFFDAGRRPGVWGDFLWSLDDPEPFPPTTMIAGEDGPVVISPAMQAAWDAAARAYAAMVQELRTSKLTATGAPAGGGARCPLDPTEWSRVGLLLDVRNGDLIEWRAGRQAVRWTALALAEARPEHKLGRVDWDDWWTIECERRRLGTLPAEKAYLSEAEALIKDRYGVASVPDTGLRRLKAALYRGDLERPKR
jgi:hypothetical protein